MLLDEARLAARLNHPNVVQTNEVGRSTDQYYIAMEYLDGHSLDRDLAAQDRAPCASPRGLRSAILAEALAGLHYAHELMDYRRPAAQRGPPRHQPAQHLRHLRRAGEGRRLRHREVPRTRDVDTSTGVVKGKIRVHGAGAGASRRMVDRRADIFSMGLILWEMLAGRRLWRGPSDPQIISRLMRDILDLRSARPEVPVELARICAKALAHSPDQRYSTAAAFRAELDATRNAWKGR